MTNIHKLIAAINPDLYCDKSVREEVKKIVKSKGYLAAADKAKIIAQEGIDVDVEKGHPLKLNGLKYPIEQHKIVYDSSAESLEPVYFWTLDFIKKQFKEVDKLMDNFVSSPGSAYFSELGAKATKMQEEAMKTLATVNTVLRSVLNLVYDLKEFNIRLELYDRLKSKDEYDKRAAILSLKQIWLDSVDIKRANSAIKVMAQQFDFVTLIDAFMAADSVKSVENLDLNDRVKRIILQRIAEFFRWVEESEKELRKRFEIERRYLQSQANMIKLYARWVKPYLIAAKKLEQNLGNSAELVNTFNSIVLELALVAKSPYDPTDDVKIGDLPKVFSSVKTRKYYSVLIVEFSFRGIPQRVGQGYSFGGKVDLIFTSYGLNEEELKILKDEMERDDIAEVMKTIQGGTDESLAEIQKDIDFFLNPEKEKAEKEKEEQDKEVQEEDTNPFSALFSFFKSNKDEKESKSNLGKDDQFEKVLRSQAILEARDKCFNVFDIYKKAHLMPSWT